MVFIKSTPWSELLGVLYALLVPRPWWFRDSGPGARDKVLWFFSGITRSIGQAQRLQTTKAIFLPTPRRG